MPFHGNCYLLGMTRYLLFNCFFLLFSAPLCSQDVEVPAGCDCPTVRLDDDFCASEAVFRGVALRSDTLWSLEATKRYDPDMMGRVATVFRVDRMMKGPDVKELTVLTGMRADDCAFHFVSGQGYLVFARREEDALVTQQCTHTRAVDTVTEGLLDSLEQVIAGWRWEGRVPVEKPCP